MDENCIRIYETSISQKDISKAFIEHDIDIEGISKKTSSLEEYF